MGTTGLVAQARGAGEAAETGALLMRGLMIGGAAGSRLRRRRRPRSSGPRSGSPPPRPRSRTWRRTYLAHPHLGSAGRDLDLCPDRLAHRAWSAPAASWSLQVAMNGINVVLDLLFVLGFGWGVAGRRRRRR